MSSTFEHLRKEVEIIRAQLAHHASEVQRLQYILNSKTDQLSKVCQHDYIEERDDDYHKPGKYYTCRFCKDFTRFNPQKR
jgi:predicted SprT family Zn-dependent metalloprotease